MAAGITGFPVGGEGQAMMGGLGAALVSAAGSKDFAVVQAISLIMVGAFVLANTVVDFLYAMLDPRVTLGTAAA